MVQGPPGFEGSEYSEYGVLIFAVLLIVGFIIAFAGRIVWRHLMSFIGAIIGGLFGFVIGTAVGGILVGLFVSMLCAIIGSFVFIYLAEVGLGVIAGLFAFFVVDEILGDDYLIIALVVAGLALIITIVFIEQALGIVTAGIGGMLVGLALLWLDWLDMTAVVVIMFATIIFGAAFQLMAIKDEARRLATPMAAATASQGAVAPVPPPTPGRTCPSCGGPLEYIPEYNRYYCYRCQRYE
ncbi:TPA: hypothetical protein HA259_07810 [Thermoplasmata archaeon]|nr:hypothetical protein [Thermoplasmata archaeon]